MCQRIRRSRRSLSRNTDALRLVDQLPLTRLELEDPFDGQTWTNLAQHRLCIRTENQLFVGLCKRRSHGRTPLDCTCHFSAHLRFIRAVQFHKTLVARRCLADPDVRVRCSAAGNDKGQKDNVNSRRFHFITLCAGPSRCLNQQSALSRKGKAEHRIDLLARERLFHSSFPCRLSRCLNQR
jgi:hypothetical protein